MKILYLTDEEKSRLEASHAKEKDGRKRDRLKAILLYSEGWSPEQISQALRIHQASIYRHVEDYEQGKIKTNYQGSKSFLTKEQTEELIAHLEANLYHHNHQIVMYIKEKYGVIYTIAGLHKWLHRQGFSYKKPKGHPHKSDPELQEQFVEEYKALKEAVKGKDEPILFMDSVHPTQATKLTYGWIRKGQTKHIGTTASWTRLNIVGAIQLGHLADTITAQYTTINAESIMDFMGKLRTKHGEKKLHLILDRAGYHVALDVAQKAKALNIELHFLPPYSPNLNPIERLWKVMNEQVRNNRFFKGAKDFKDAIGEFFEQTLPGIAERLVDRISDNFQILKA
jgi:transposase